MTTTPETGLPLPDVAPATVAESVGFLVLPLTVILGGLGLPLLGGVFVGEWVWSLCGLLAVGLSVAMGLPYVRSTTRTAEERTAALDDFIAELSTHYGVKIIDHDALATAIRSAQELAADPHNLTLAQHRAQDRLDRAIIRARRLSDNAPVALIAISADGRVALHGGGDGTELTAAGTASLAPAQS